MQRVGVLFLCLLFSTAALADGVRRVELKILDGDSPQGGVSVRVKYADGDRTNGVTLDVVTSDDGVAAFDVPTDVIWVTVPELNRAVIGKELRLQDGATITRFTLRPREWVPEVGRSR